MFRVPEYHEILSVRLSKVLADIGVNERTVMKRRRINILMEALYREETQASRDKEEENLLQKYFLDSKSATYDRQAKSILETHFLGSHSEGTTTSGLRSDSDGLHYFTVSNMIQDLNEWKPNLITYLMIQDKNISPGYCLLQRLRKDAPLPVIDMSNALHITDTQGRLLLRNTAIKSFFHIEGDVMHGPATTRVGFVDDIAIDLVFAFLCKSWPVKARFQNEGGNRWPPEYIRRYCTTTGCFLVPVGSKGSEYEKFEWRISTTLAEKCLMFNLNITQIRCYVLMKMILKTFINPYFKDTISSFMCKTALLHCISNTHYHLWKERNIYLCLLLSLSVLYNYIRNENCPHFFITENNLLKGKISAEVRPLLLRTLHDIINMDHSDLLKIECDGLGSRLYLMSSDFRSFNSNVYLSGSLLHSVARVSNNIFKDLRIFISKTKSSSLSLSLLKKAVLDIVNRFTRSRIEGLRKIAGRMIATWICTTIGSIMASRNIHGYNAISAEALMWISLGLNTDIASSNLKQASMLCCTGKFKRSEIVLKEIERKYEVNGIEPVCGCYYYLIPSFGKRFIEIADTLNEITFQNVTATCVCFIQYEINCVPHELRYEMFRSTKEDLAYRGRFDKWMEFAVVDSLTYLYFLQFKVYSHLGKEEGKQTALTDLISAIDQDKKLRHRETALNLLGQCMEQERQLRNAVKCYMQSLYLRKRNNAAKWHLCILLSTLANGRCKINA